MTHHMISRPSIVPFIALAVFVIASCGAANAAPLAGPAGTVIRADDTGSDQGGDSGPLPGQLIVPGSQQPSQDQNQDKKGKQCMTTCAQWGEECMLVNQGAGGMQRRCRRVCKQFTEECF